MNSIIFSRSASTTHFSEDATTSTLLLLPDEILIDILQHLSSRDLSSICRCCHSLYEVCKDDKLWKRLFHDKWAACHGRFHREVPQPIEAGWRKAFEFYFGGYEDWWNDAKETTAFDEDDFLPASPPLPTKEAHKSKGKNAKQKEGEKAASKKQAKKKKKKTSSSKSPFGFFKRRKQRNADDSPRPEFRMMLCGAGGIGAKSALIIQFLNHTFVTKYDPTIEDTYEKRIVIDSKPVDCVFLDVAGQEEFAALRPQGIRWSEGFLVGYSITSRSSFESAVRWRREILNEKRYRPPMILVGNKSDLEEERQVSAEEGKKLAEEWGCPFFETSCKTRENIEECILTLVSEMRVAREMGAPRSVSLISPNGTKYAGIVVDGRPHGLGTCEYAEKDNGMLLKYSGWWENGQRHGTGRCWFRNGRPVQGEWRFGRLHALN